MDQGFTYKGTMTLRVMRDGKVIDTRKVNNVLLNTGKDWLIQRCFSTSTAAVSGEAATYFYVGTSNSAGAAAATDTTAQTTEIARMAFTYATGGTNGAMSGTATFPSATANGGTGSATITEAGIFNGAGTSGDGVFICRALFGAVTKQSTDTLEVKWDVAFS